MATMHALVMHTLLTGLGATLAVDAWALLRRRLFGLPLPDYGLLGRWLAHMPRGRFVQASMAAAPPMRGERLLGWIAHYGIGLAFAALLPLCWGVGWLDSPRLGPALAVGLGTVAAPFLLMQPGMGLGIAASRTARPNRTRLHSLATHAVFGFGLYAVARATGLLFEH